MRKGFFSKSRLLQSKAPPSLAPRCGACGLYKHCLSPKMPVAGEGKKGILVCGEGPGWQEDRDGKPFVGKAGQFLTEVLREYDVELYRDCFITNSVICRKTENGKDKAPSQKEIEYCRPNLMTTIAKLQPSLIILLGGPSVSSLIGGIWKEDPGGITKWAGFLIPCQKPNAWIAPTFHPSYVQRQEDANDKVTKLLFRKHIEAALEKTSKPYDPAFFDKGRVEGRVRRIFDSKAARTAIGEFCRAECPVAFDYETNMLKPDSDAANIVCCSMSDGYNTIAYPWTNRTAEATREFLRSPVPKVSSNMKFEERWSIAKLGTRVRNWHWDTMLNAHIMDNRPGITSIKFQAFVLCGAPSWNDHIKPFLKEAKGRGGNVQNRIHEVDINDLLEYCGKDSYWEWHVADRQKKLTGYG